jgi:hypothetical protein
MTYNMIKISVDDKTTMYNEVSICVGIEGIAKIIMEHRI